MVFSLKLLKNYQFLTIQPEVTFIHLEEKGRFKVYLEDNKEQMLGTSKADKVEEENITVFVGNSG